MPAPNTDQPDASTDERPNVSRRPLLKALGVGAALSFGPTRGAANHDDPHPPHVDSHYGYATPDASEIPERLDPDREIELHTDLPADPADPDRPPFFHFKPTGVHVQPGDVVQFSLAAPDHSVTAYHPAQGFQRRVPEGVPQFSSPVLGVGAAWLYEFDEPGVYDIYCGPHHVLGMVMRLVCGDLDDDDVPAYEDTFEGRTDPPLFAPFNQAFLERELNALSDQNEGCEWPWVTPVEVLDADVLDPEHVQEHGSVPFTAVLEELDRFEPHDEHE